MAFYYCKSGGTATGDGGRYASEKSNNSWATEFSAVTEYYDSIESALGATTVPTASDFIYVSSASTFSAAGAITYDLVTPIATPIQCYSVDDAAVTEYLAGALETAAAGQDVIVDMRIAVYGISLSIGDDLQVQTNGMITLQDGTVTLEGTGDQIGSVFDSPVYKFTDVTIDAASGSTTHLIFLRGGGYFEMTGGSTTSSGGTLNDLVGGDGGTGGMTVIIAASDLSGHGSGTFLLGNQGATFNVDDGILMVVTGCKLNASVGFVEEAFSSYNHKFLMTNSSSSSAAAEYQFYQRTWAGDVEDQDDTGIHRDESTAFGGGTKVSMKVTTTADCSKGRTLIFDLPARYAALSSTSTDTLRIYFAQPNTQPDLTDTNCWAALYYPDGTTKNLWVRGTNRSSNILAAGTQHTDDSGSSTWLDGASALTGHDEYRMDIALDGTDGVAGADSVPIIRIFITEPSATIYFDTTIDVVA